MRQLFGASHCAVITVIVACMRQKGRGLGDRSGLPSRLYCLKWIRLGKLKIAQWVTLRWLEMAGQGVVQFRPW